MKPFSAACDLPPLTMNTTEEIVGYFKKLNFRDEIGHPLHLNMDFIKLAMTAAHSRKIKAHNLLEQPVPEHVLKLFTRLGMPAQLCNETDLQPVIDLVNWVIEHPLQI
ncbi:hypothetical protein CDQ28_24010 [Salmonella enterica]|nr:hypothetical protein [Salmonella enterica]EBI4025568.1 hypothetical protein [Salmonella enterica]EBS7468559.1 hypothetical protein [Salmonella enterica]ELS1357900.1 hypothetical protein [Salmonella enterica]ELZ3469924.1 hypothetical protein [Salmonella enterica]